MLFIRSYSLSERARATAHMQETIFTSLTLKTIRCFSIHLPSVGSLRSPTSPDVQTAASEYCYVSKYSYANVPDQLRPKCT